jgi:hypothetical protein
MMRDDHQFFMLKLDSASTVVLAVLNLRSQEDGLC